MNPQNFSYPICKNVNVYLDRGLETENSHPNEGLILFGKVRLCMQLGSVW